MYNYFEDLHANIKELKLAHQADIIRVFAIEKYGGVWLDSDIIVLEPLTVIFEWL